MPKLTKENLINRVRVAESGCWLWSGAIKNHERRSLPYGWVTYNNKQMSAHRAAWLVTFGDIPDGMFVCHKCDVPQCVNPEHLFLGTASDNMKDMWNKRRHAPPNQGVVGSRSSKLTVSDVRKVRSLLANGVIQKEIARQFNVTQTTVSAIKTGKNWGRYD